LKNYKQMGKTRISLKNISKTYNRNQIVQKTLRNRLLVGQSNLTSGKLKSLSKITLSINEGEIFGVIGRNGSGKSTLLNIILGAIKPDPGGIINLDGSIMKLSLGIGVDPNLSARDNIYLNGSLIGMSFKQIGEKFNEIIDFANLDEFIDVKVKFFSSGMKSRLLFSIAMHANPDILLLDEFFGGVGDEDFKTKSQLAFNNKIIKNKTVVVVSHSIQIIKKYCTRVLWLDKGQIISCGETLQITDEYLNSFNTKHS